MKNHEKQIQRNASRKTNCEIANSFFIKKLLLKNAVKLFQKYHRGIKKMETFKDTIVLKRPII